MIATCPPDDTLRRFAIGEIDDALGQEIETHLVECPACEETVAQFDSADDTLIRHLPLAAVAAEGSSPGWLDQLRDGPPVGQAARLPDGDAKLRTHVDAPTTDIGQFSGYDLLGVLGRGGMGVVYRARHRHLNRHVALKVLSPRLTTAPEARRRFEREIQVLGGLHHPGIVMATDAGRVDEAAYLVMELIDGIDLSRMVRQGGPLSIAEACEVGRQMADALAAAHQTSTVHRDVKPSNVMVDRRGRVKLLDFGLAHLNILSTDSLETSLGRLLGTLDYMAPEQAGGDEQPGPRADLYGLGATLFFLLTGRPPHGPHTGRTLVGQLRALAAEEAPRVSTLRADVPAELDEYIARLLRRAPSERPESAEAVAAELGKWAGGDLAARVVEADSNATANDVEAAQQSLCELLGRATTSENATAASPSAAAAGRRNGRKPLVALALAGFAASAFGAVILLQMQRGTIRIDSEVENIQVEVLNEDEKVVDNLQIVRGNGNETVLRAGKYRVRIAGEHKDVFVDDKVITLKRGETVVAKITQTGPSGEPSDGFLNRWISSGAKTGDWERFIAAHAQLNMSLSCVECHQATEKVASPFLSSRTAPVATAEKIYRGKPESEWQRLFEAETEPKAKSEAAVALLNLAAQYPAQQQIRKVLQIGGELVRAKLGENSLVFVFDHLQNQLGEEVTKQIYDQVPKLPARILSVELSREALSANDSESAFALSLLRWVATKRILEDQPTTAETVGFLSNVRPGLDRSPVCDVVAAIFVDRLPEEERPPLFSRLSRAATNLHDAPNSEFNRKFSKFLLDTVFAKSEWPRELQTQFSRLVLDSIIKRDPFAFNSRFHFDLVEYELFSPPYDPQYVSERRKWTQSFRDGWLDVANEYLGEHQFAPYDDPTREVAKTLEMLRFYSDGDSWPVDKTAAILTEQLRSYFGGGGVLPLDKPASELLPASPAMLLTQIVRTTGKLPEFAISGGPRVTAVNERLNQFERHLDSLSDPETQLTDPNVFAGLFDEAPYQVTKIALREFSEAAVPGRGRDSRGGAALRGGRGGGGRGGRGLTSNLRLGGAAAALRLASMGAYVNVTEAGATGGRADSYTDPLLLLACLSELTGENEAQDDRIESVLRMFSTTTLRPNRGTISNGLSFHLIGLLQGQLKFRHDARRMLESMAAKSKSQTLTDTIKGLLSATPAAAVATVSTQPAVQPNDTGAAPTAAAEERVFKGKPESEWLRLFRTEVDPKSRKEAVGALIGLAAQKSPEQMIDQLIGLGADLMRTESRENSLEFAFQAPFGDYYEMYNVIWGQLQKQPLPNVVSALVKASTSQSDDRAAFALRMLVFFVKPVSDADPSASRIAFTELDRPLLGLNQSAAVLITRTYFSNHANETTEFGILVVSLRQLTALLTRAPNSEQRLRDRFIDGLLNAASARDNWPDDLKLAFSELAIKSIIAGRGDVARRFSDALGFPGSPYDAKYVTQLRDFLKPLYSKWLVGANAYLEGRSQPPFDAATRAIVQSLDRTVLVYSDKDAWPVNTSADFLTDHLRRYYTDKPNETTPQSVEDLLPASPALLLTQIIRITGKIPDFVRTGHPRSSAVYERLKRFSAAVDANDSRSLPNHNVFAGLYDEAPLETIQLAMNAKPLDGSRRGQTIGFPIRHWLILGTTGASVRMTSQGAVDGKPDSFVDPLVLLATFHVMAGQREEWDAKIAQLLSETETGYQSPLTLGGGGGFGGPGGGGYPSDPRSVGLKTHLQNLLASPLKARHHARRILDEMAVKSKNQALTDAIKEILATAPAEPATSTSPAARSETPSADTDARPEAAADPERLYKGHSAAEWQRLFLGETDAVAKLDAATSMLVMAETDPDERKLERLQFVGAELVRSNLGENPLLEALTNWSRTAFGRPLVDPVNTFGGGVDGRGQSGRGSRAARGQAGGGGRGRGGAGRGRGGGVSRNPRGGFEQFSTTEQSAAYRQYLTQLRKLSDTIPADRLAAEFTKIATSFDDHRAAFALGLLKDRSARILSDESDAAQTVLNDLKVTLTVADHPWAVLLTRAKFAAKATDAQKREIAQSLKDIANLLSSRLSEPLGPAMGDSLLDSARALGTWPADARQGFAPIVQNAVVRRGDEAIGRYFALNAFETELYEGGFIRDFFVPPYDARYVEEARKRTQYFLQEWLPLTQQLQSSARPFDDATRDFTATLDKVLPLYSDGDAWHVHDLAEILTQKLRLYYDEREIDMPADELLPASPAFLLTQIVRITGKIPDFVLSGSPRPKDVRARLDHLKRFLASDRELQYGDLDAPIRGLFELAPLEVVKASLGKAKARPAWQQTYTPRRLLFDTSNDAVQWPRQQRSSNLRESSTIDALLLLAMLTSLTGESEAQDDQIATLVAEDQFPIGEATFSSGLNPADRQPPPTTAGLKKHLELLLASPLQCREHARTLLAEMKSKTKSAKLLDAIKQIIP